MRPATPNFNFTHQAGPSSPPQTPTTSSHTFGKNRRHGMHFAQQLPQLSHNIVPNGQGTTFSYIPSARPEDLSPRSSTSESSAASSSTGSPPRSLTSTPGEPVSSSPPPREKHILAEGNFTVEEFDDADYDDFDSDDESVIRPHQYEDAESDRAHSIKSVPRNDLDSKLYSGIRNLHCESDIDVVETEREAWAKKVKEERRRKRRSSGSVKRTLIQSIGSDTDEEDIQPVFEGVNENGSNARRLRRRMDEEDNQTVFEGVNEIGSSARMFRRKMDRGSLVFEDPPPRIEELEEPESCEELVEVKESDDEGQGVDKNLPYYVQDMDVDSDSEDDD